MNDKEYKGDLYYIDPAGNSWRITQRPGERNPKQNYWHADRVVRPGETLTPREGHRVSASAYRLLIGIDGSMVEGVNDGSTAQDDEESDDAENGRYGICQILTDAQADAYIENRRQAYLG